MNAFLNAAEAVYHFGTEKVTEGRQLLRKVDELIWWRIVPLTAVGFITMWWLSNYAGTIGLVASVVIGVSLYLAVWHYIAKPLHFEVAALIGATLRLVTLKNPVAGAISGADVVLGIAAGLGRDILFTSLVIWTWPFAPWTFWIALICIVILTSLGTPAGIKSLLMGLYTIGVLAMIPTAGNDAVFDGCTGKSLVLVDPITGNEHGRLKPTECDTLLYSPESGEPLRTQTSKEALDRNPKAGGSSFWDKAGSIWNPLNQSEPKSAVSASTAAGPAAAKFESACGDVIIPQAGARFYLRAGETKLIEQVDRDQFGWFQVGPLSDIPLGTAATIGFNAGCGGDTVTAKQEGWFVVAKAPQGGVGSNPALAAQLMNAARAETRAVLRAESALAAAR